MSVSAITYANNTTTEIGNINMDVFSLGERANITTSVSPISILPGSMQGLGGFYGFYSIKATTPGDCVVTMPVINETVGVTDGWNTMVRNDSNVTVVISTTVFTTICKISPGMTVSLNADLANDSWSVAHLVSGDHDGVLLCKDGNVAFQEGNLGDVLAVTANGAEWTPLSVPPSAIQPGPGRSILQTAADGSTVGWATNVVLPGTLAVKGTTLLYEMATLVKTPLSLQSTGGIFSGGRLTANESFDLNGELLISSDPGTAGSVLVSNGPGLPPSWVTLSSLLNP